MTLEERVRALERECRLTNGRVQTLESQMKALVASVQSSLSAKTTNNTEQPKSAAAAPPPSYAKLMFDGGSRGNPGLCGSGYVIYPCSTADFEPHKEVPPITGYAVVSEKETNNYAEYMGLILALQKAKEQGFNRIHVMGDSKLVISQLGASWKCGDKLRPLYEEAALLLAGFRACTLEHIPREKNMVADRLANKAMDEH